MLPPSLIATALGLLKRFWFVLPILVLLGALWHSNTQRDAAREDVRRGVVTQTQLEERNRVVQRSLDLALQRVEDNNRRLAEGERQMAAQRLQAAKELATAQARYTRTAATVAALEASAKRTPAEPCAVSDLAKKALEDL